jgi:AcrR family transcriptional regulator
MPRAKDDEKRQRIMGAAKRLFANPKNTETTLKELARLADVTPSSLYTYFSTREEIVGAILDDSWDWMSEELIKDGATQMDRKRLLRQFCGMYFPEMLADSNLTSLIIQYPHAVPDIKEKLDVFAAFLGPGLEALSKKYNGLPVDEHARKAQAAILILGCLSLRYFSSNVDLGFTEKDILNAFRAFLPTDES